jgi:pimeloyl-ACP methyl ester carboxylesterase
MPALTIPTGDTRLHALDIPGGAPSLVLINGAFGTLQNWDQVTARLGGAYRAIRYAAQHPGQVAGLVLIDGGFPIAVFDDEAKQKARVQFRRLGLLMRIAAAVGRGARMSPAQAADLVIEMDAVNGQLASDFTALDCPATFVLGTGGHSGAPAEAMRPLRESVTVAQAANERVSVFATAPCNHTQILTKCADVVVAAIEDVVRRSS